VPALLGGSVVVETVFDLPGVGRYAYEGLQQRDVFVVMATTTLAGGHDLPGDPPRGPPERGARSAPAA
jgi:peptide/nickel transport system permease protein